MTFFRVKNFLLSGKYFPPVVHRNLSNETRISYFDHHNPKICYVNSHYLEKRDHPCDHDEEESIRVNIVTLFKS